MKFKYEFIAAWQGGQDYRTLQALAVLHQAQVPQPQQTYDALQEIWLEFGYDKSEDATPLQDTLEAVMEKVWYRCPVEPSR